MCAKEEFLKHTFDIPVVRVFHSVLCYCFSSCFWPQNMCVEGPGVCVPPTSCDNQSLLRAEPFNTTPKTGIFSFKILLGELQAPSTVGTYSLWHSNHRSLCKKWLTIKRRCRHTISKLWQLIYLLFSCKLHLYETLHRLMSKNPKLKWQ